MPSPMSEEQYRAMLMKTITWLIGAARRHSPEGFLAITAIDTNDVEWQILVRPAGLQFITLFEPQTVIFSVN